jgi:hypothetical protein
VLLCGEHHRPLREGEPGVVAPGKQRFPFHGPRGAVRPQAPTLGRSLVGRAGTHPDLQPGTIEPDWDGSPLHLEPASDVYLTAWTRREARIR